MSHFTQEIKDNIIKFVEDICKNKLEMNELDYIILQTILIKNENDLYYITDKNLLENYDNHRNLDLLDKLEDIILFAETLEQNSTKQILGVDSEDDLTRIISKHLVYGGNKNNIEFIFMFYVQDDSDAPNVKIKYTNGNLEIENLPWKTKHPWKSEFINEEKIIQEKE